MKHLAAFGAAALLGLIASTPVMAQQTGETLLRTLLDTAESTYASNDFDLRQQAELRFSLDEDDTDSETVRLDRGQRYLVIGVCDEDCSDFDLTVWAPDGSTVGQDILEDDAPIVDFRTETSGAYTIVGSMPACSIEPCLAGVRIYHVR